jgi:hypothetical protein
MGFLRNVCDQCLGYMKIEKIGEDYVMSCPHCKKKAEKNDEKWE